MVRWAGAVPLWAAALAAPAAACSLLVDSDVGVRSDGGGAGGGDAASTDGGGDSSDAPDCPDQVGFPPFADDFASDDLTWAIDPKIQRDGPGAVQAGVSAGALRFSPGPDGTDNAWVKSGEFDFLEGRVAVRIPSVTTDSATEAYVALLAPSIVHRMRFDGSKLRVPGGGTSIYDRDSPLWWQIRNEDLYLHFETSTDGITWSELDRIPADIDPTQARIEIGVSVAAPSGGERGQFVVDDLNLPPCR